MQREIRIMLDVEDEEDYAQLADVVWAVATALDREVSVMLDGDADLDIANLEWFECTDWTEANRF